MSTVLNESSRRQFLATGSLAALAAVLASRMAFADEKAVAEDVVAARVAITDGAQAASNSLNGSFEIDRL